MSSRQFQGGQGRVKRKARIRFPADNGRTKWFVPVRRLRFSFFSSPTPVILVDPIVNFGFSRLEKHVFFFNRKALFFNWNGCFFNDRFLSKNVKNRVFYQLKLWFQWICSTDFFNDNFNDRFFCFLVVRLVIFKKSCLTPEFPKEKGLGSSRASLGNAWRPWS